MGTKAAIADLRHALSLVIHAKEELSKGIGRSRFKGPRELIDAEIGLKEAIDELINSPEDYT